MTKDPKMFGEKAKFALTTAVFLAALVASCLRGAFPRRRKKRVSMCVESVAEVIKSTHLRWTCGRFAINGDDGDDDEATNC